MNTLPSGYIDFVGLSRLRLSAENADQATQDEIAAQFETFFIQQMLKAMRDTVGDGLLSSSQTELYQEMHDQELSLALARSGGLGIKDLFAKAISPNNQQGDSGDRETVKVPPTALFPVSRPETSLHTPNTQFSESLWSGESVHATTKPTNQQQNFHSASEFAAALWPEAQAAAVSIGAKPQALIAIAALETGWGKHIPQRADGTSSNNLFGIKAGASWQDESVTAPTLEFLGGSFVRRDEAFRAYPTTARAFADFATLIKSRERYADALQKAGDPVAFVTALQDAGYATDPEYASKLINVLRSKTMLQAQSQVSSQHLKEHIQTPIG